MKAITILLASVIAVLLTSCTTSNKLTLKERFNLRSVEIYQLALDDVEKEDYILAYIHLDSSYTLSSSKPDMLNKIKGLLRNEPKIEDAILKTYIPSYFENEIKKQRYKNRLHAKENIAYRTERLKKISAKSSKQAEKNYIDFFGDSPEKVLTERKKKIKELTDKRKAGLKKGTFLSLNAKGNLEVTKPLSCVDIDTLSSSHTPADIFTGVSACIKKNDIYKAVRLYALALTYGHYDKLRMVDKTSRGAISVLQFKTFSLANKELKEKIKAEIKRQSSANSNSKDFKTLCEGIKKLGKPNYYPKYMVRHGMSAFTGKASGILPDFNEEESWHKSIHGFLKCS